MTSRRALALSAALLCACAPSDIARSSCQSEMLSTADPWTCTITGERVGRPSWIEFDTESRNPVALVKITLTVTAGTLKVGYNDLTGDRQLTVTPSSPASVDMQTRLNRDRRSFTLSFQPVGGDVQGLRGTVRYSTPLIR